MKIQSFPAHFEAKLIPKSEPWSIEIAFRTGSEKKLYLLVSEFFPSPKKKANLPKGIVLFRCVEITEKDKGYVLIGRFFFDSHHWYTSLDDWHSQSLVELFLARQTLFNFRL